MRFQVPQYIETEDKIVGPLTLKQFIYLAGAGGVSFILFIILNKSVAFLLSFILVAFAIALAFVKINGVPFPRVLLNAAQFMMKPSLYVWKRKTEEKEIVVPNITTAQKQIDEKREQQEQARQQASPVATNDQGGTPLSKLKQQLKTGSVNIPKREPPLHVGPPAQNKLAQDAPQKPVPPEGSPPQATPAAQQPSANQAPPQAPQSAQNTPSSTPSQQQTQTATPSPQQQKAVSSVPPPPQPPPTTDQNTQQTKNSTAENQSGNPKENFEQIKTPGGKSIRAKRVDFD